MIKDKILYEFDFDAKYFTENNTTRTVLKLPAVLAPTKAAIFPLVKKDGLPEVAKQIVDDLIFTMKTRKVS